MADDKYFDFIISGGGLVGCLVVRQLAESGLNCCLVEKKEINDIPSFDNYAPLSLNYKSYLTLKKFKLWDKIVAHTYPIRKLNIESYHSLNRLSFNAADISLDNLGYVIDRRHLHQLLLNEIKDKPNIEIYDQESISGLKDIANNDKYKITGKLSSGRLLKCKYLIVSDGIDSTIRNELSIQSSKIDYSQTSFIYNCSALFKKNNAIQIFNKYGIFAAIPYGDKKINLILTINKKDIPLFFDSDKKVDSNLFKDIFKDYVSNFSDLKFVSQYNLVTSRANEISRENIVLLGNSSQLLHPVGAQGFNLAVSNIDSLTDFLIDGELDIRAFVAEITELRQSVFNNIDLAINVFGGQKFPSKLISFIIMNSIKSSQILKNNFLKNILGIENYPYLNIGSDA